MSGLRTHGVSPPPTRGVSRLPERDRSRVLMLLENNPYPQDDRVHREARMLAAAGHGVTVIAPRGAGQRRKETLNGVTVRRYRAPREGNGLLGYLWEYGWSLAASSALVLGVFVRPGFDVIHAHNPPDLFVFVALLFKLARKQFVFDVHDLGPEIYDARFNGNGSALARRALVVCERLSARVADRVLVTNESYRETLRARVGLPDEKITTVRNGPDLGRIHAVPADETLRRRAASVIGYVGTLGYQDGVDYLLRALAVLVGELGARDVRCFVMGDGEALPSLRRHASELGLDDVVVFTGWLDDDDLRRHLSTIDIGVVPDPSNPYNDRSTMIKVAEYMAVGKPIVAFDLPEHRVTAADAALYATPNDERDFALKLEQLIAAPELRQAMGIYGLERVHERLEWRYSAGWLLDAYARLDGDVSVEAGAGRAR